MIIKTHPKTGDKKTSFRRLIKYIEAPDKEKTIYTNCRGFFDDPQDTEEIIKEMEATAARNVRTADPILHDTMNYREGEIPSKEQVEEAVDIYLKEMNLENCQCYYGLHQNTDNLHIHICVNRIDPASFRAVQPANGWTYKAHERAARKIEISQGWEVEKSGKLCRIVDGKAVDIKAEVEKDTGINQRARDFENYAAQKSGIRIAKEDIAPVLFDENVTTWRDLHARLAEKGVRLHKKGSGAILLIGDVPVKLSDVSQKLSMGKLVKRLGEFEEREETVEIKEQEPQPLRPTKGVRDYTEARSCFYEERRKVEEEYKAFYSQAWKDLRSKQRKEIKELYGEKGSWRGKGKILNAMRSVMAMEHVQQREELKKELRAMKKKMPRAAFPSYEEWERGRGRKRIAELWRYRESIEGVVTGTNNENVAPRQTNKLLRYSTSFDRKEGVLKFIKRDILAFVDKGKRIDIYEWGDEETLRDVLKLAQEKWGHVTLHGSQKYKEACVEVAIRNNIKISNPELQEVIETKMADLKDEKNKTMRNLKSVKSAARGRMILFGEYCEAVKAEKYRITAFWTDKNDKRMGAVLGKKSGEVSKGMTLEEIFGSWPQIEKWNAEHKNIYVTPLSDAMHHILVDDITKEKLAQLKADGYTPAVVVESSPGNYQAILNVPAIGHQLGFDKEVSNRLMRDLNKKYGDPKILGAIHPHRPPGWNNFKQKYMKEDGTFPEVRLIEAKDVVCHKALDDAKKILEECKNMKEKLKRQHASEIMLRQREYEARGTLSPYEAYMVHAKDIQEHMSITNYSQLDSMIALRMYTTGYTQSEIAEGIRQGAKDVRPEEDKDKHVWAVYAERTALYPESVAGQAKLRMFEGKKIFWLRLEGRMPERAKDIER